MFVCCLKCLKYVGRTISKGRKIFNYIFRFITSKTHPTYLPAFQSDIYLPVFSSSRKHTILYCLYLCNAVHFANVWFIVHFILQICDNFADTARSSVVLLALDYRMFSLCHLAGSTGLVSTVV